MTEIGSRKPEIGMASPRPWRVVIPFGAQGLIEDAWGEVVSEFDPARAVDRENARLIVAAVNREHEVSPRGSEARISRR